MLTEASWPSPYINVLATLGAACGHYYIIFDLILDHLVHELQLLSANIHTFVLPLRYWAIMLDSGAQVTQVWKALRSYVQLFCILFFICSYV